jgi:hypothetical protein
MYVCVSVSKKLANACLFVYMRVDVGVTRDANCQYSRNKACLC